MELLNITVDDLNLALDEILHMQTEASNLIDHLADRHKRSLLPFGSLFSVLFGTADQNDLDSVKADIKQLYQNQMNQTNVLNDVISITNVSRGIINKKQSWIVVGSGSGSGILLLVVICGCLYWR